MQPSTNAPVTRAAASSLPPLAASVRLATSGDAAAVAALVNRAYAVEGFFVDGERTTAAEVEQLRRAGQLVVLEGALGLVGAVYLSRRGDGAVIGMVSVAPELQGFGLGTRLVRIAEALSEAMGCRSVELRVVNLREELALWYRHLGYQPTGTAPFEARAVKQPCHFVEMRKPLHAGGVAALA